MRLKKLTLNGFKTFPYKFKFLFDSSITTIIGPNGTGKSNVADAFRWVIGEQRPTALRCKKMEDLIFSGNDADRKPMSMCEVKIILSNHDHLFPIDYDEIEITRKSYRSGENIYMINNNKCRLKDITNLFLDTGMGVYAYSIIQQGEVEEIIKASSIERREIIEEAAGVLKYKKQKEEALRDLEKTNRNLERINDFVFGLENRLKVLEKEMRRAKAYKKLLSRAEETKILLELIEFKELQELINTNKDSIEQYNTQKIKLQSQITNLESEKTGLKVKLVDKEKLLSQSEQKKFSDYEQFNKNSQEITLLKEKLSNLNIKRNETRNMVTTSKTKLEDYSKQIKDLNERNTKINIELEKMNSTVNSKTEEQNKYTEQLDLLEKDLNNYKTSVIDILNEKSRYENELTRLQTLISQDKIQVEKKETENSTFSDEHKRLGLELQQLNKDLEKNNTLKGEKIKSSEELYSKTEDKKRELNTKLDALRELENELKSLSSRKELLINLDKNYEGFFEGVKSILKAIEKDGEKFSGLHNAIINIIDIEEKYNIAIESALGNAIQFIISENLDDAKQAIDYLKRYKKGRATFIAIENLKAYKRENISHIEKEDGFINYANNVIKCNEKYRPVIDNLLAGTVIIDDLDHAIKIERKYKITHKNFRIVTLEGDILSPSGRLTGGTKSGDELGLISRKSLIEKLEHQIIESGKLVKTRSQEMSKCEVELSSEQEDYEKSLREIENIKYSIINLENRKENIKGQKTHFEKNIEINSLEIETLKKDIESYSMEKTRLQDESQKLIEKSNQIEDEILGFNKDINDCRSKMNFVLNEITDIKHQQTRLKADHKNNSENLNLYRSFIQELENDIKFHTEQLDNSFKEEKEMNEKLEIIEQETKSFEDMLFKLQNEIDAVSGEKENISSKINEIETQVYGIRDELDKLVESHREIENRHIEFNIKMEEIKKRTKEFYDVDLEDKLKEVEAKMDEYIKEDIREKSERLQRKIANYGEVNTYAIYEFEELEKEHNERVNVREDILKSIDSTKEIIRKINETTKEKFKDTFDIVNKNFSLIYAKLFGEGGEAELRLADPNDLLNSGVDFMVKPPGKRPAHIDLLSGGEKALTAAALLLALFKYKPSPFCILDELDSDLDDANVIRLYNLVREYSQKTQFLVITHNKKAMEFSDVIYGVTSEEQGVSKVISAKFEGDKLTH